MSESVAASQGERTSAARPSARTSIALGTTLVGLLSGARVLLVARVKGAPVTPLEALTTGLLDGWLWIPLVPAALALARRFDPDRAGAPRALLLHAAAAPAFSFLQLALFAAASAGVRAARFGDPFALRLPSAVAVKLAPGVLAYAALVLAVWWWARRGPVTATVAAVALPTAGSPATAPEPAVEFASGRGRLFVRPTEVDWVSAAGNYLELHAGGTVHLVRATLDEAHRRLGAERFARIHRSTLVRLGAPREVVAGGRAPGVRLADGTWLAAGRSRRAELERLARG